MPLKARNHLALCGRFSKRRQNFLKGTFYKWKGPRSFKWANKWLPWPPNTTPINEFPSSHSLISLSRLDIYTQITTYLKVSPELRWTKDRTWKDFHFCIYLLKIVIASLYNGYSVCLPTPAPTVAHSLFIAHIRILWVWTVLRKTNSPLLIVLILD